MFSCINEYTMYALNVILVGLRGVFVLKYGYHVRVEIKAGGRCALYGSEWGIVTCCFFVVGGRIYYLTKYP